MARLTTILNLSYSSRGFKADIFIAAFGLLWLVAALILGGSRPGAPSRARPRHAKLRPVIATRCHLVVGFLLIMVSAVSAAPRDEDAFLRTLAARRPRSPTRIDYEHGLRPGDNEGATEGDPLLFKHRYQIYDNDTDRLV